MIVLEEKGIRATFDPQHGCNLVSLKIQEMEWIDQQTKKGFLESSRGLGPLIGPHFYHRAVDAVPFFDASVMERLATTLPFIPDAEPFSHGIARYVPWRVNTQEKTSFHAELDCHDRVLDWTLGELEGFDFSLTFSAVVTERTLEIHYHASSTTQPVVVGLHTYYEKKKGIDFVELLGAPFYYDKLKKRVVPPEWLLGQTLKIPLNQPLDYTFSPQLNREGFGEVKMQQGVSSLKIEAKAEPDLSFQLYCPEKSSYICIEPIAALNPRLVTHKKASLLVKISY